MKKFFFLLITTLPLLSAEANTIETWIRNTSDQFHLMIQTEDETTHTLNPKFDDKNAYTVSIPLTFRWDNGFYKAPLILGYYNFENPDDYIFRPFCIEKIVLHLTKKQMKQLDSIDFLDLNINTSLLWKMGTLGWGNLF